MSLMRKRVSFRGELLSAVLFLTIQNPGTALAQAAAATSTAGQSATTPLPKDTDHWKQLFQVQTDAAVKAQPEVIILGDSITEMWGWRNGGGPVWNARLKPLNACIFGVSGDKTENLLWRIENSGFGTAFTPKVAVVLIGANNSFREMPEEVAAGTAVILKEIRRRAPSTKILLLGVFPLKEDANNPLRGRIKEINSLYEKMADNQNIFFLDFGEAFLQPDGSISKEIMADFVHPTTKGYEIYADHLVPKIEELLK